MSDRPYVRVYYNDLIRDYPEVWGDDAQLATWLRLLCTADPMWPTPPELPRSAKARILDKLVTSTLLSLLPSHRFRVKGLDGERGRRSDAARNAAALRWQSAGNADGNAETMPKPKPSRAEAKTSRADQSADEPHIEAWLQVKYRLPTDRQRAFLDRYLSVFDVTGPQRMARIILENPADPIAALKEDLDRHREERLSELSNGHVLEPRPKPKREPWQDLLREKLAADEEALQDRTRLPGVPS